LGLIYSSSDSSQLISALQKNIQSGKEASEQLKSGSQQVIAAVDGKTLSGAAYKAGKGLFSDLIVPTISKVTSAIDSIESELQTYSSADALVSGEGTLDEDKLMQQIATKKAMKASVDASAALARTLSRNNPVAKVLDALLNVQSNLARMSNDFEDDIRELEKKLEKLHTFSSQTNGLFSNSLNDMKVAMQNCLILENTVVNSDGSYSLPEGVDKSWFNQLKKASDLNGITGDKQPDVGNREYKLIDLGYGKIWLWVEKGKRTATSEDIAVSLAYNEWLSRMIAKHGLGVVQGDRGKGMDELFYEQNATLIKELSTGIDSVTGKKLTTAEKLGKTSLLANGLITMGVMVKGVVKVSTPKNSPSNKNTVIQGSKNGKNYTLDKNKSNGNKSYKKASGAGKILDINIKKFEIKNKHLNSSTAKRARKFNVSSAEEANKIVQDALKNGKLVETIPNGVGSQGQNSFSSIIDTGKVIGTKGETHIKIVYDELKNVWTTYPVPKP
jgi:hypothetical protein